MLFREKGMGRNFMDLQSKILGALIFTYFISRLTLRLPMPLGKSWGILAAHAIALGLIAAGVAGLRSPLGVFSAEQLLIYLSPQVLWCLLDLLREHPVGVKGKAAASGNEAP